MPIPAQFIVPDMSTAEMLDLIKEPTVAAGWDESEHPRDPGGEGGGQFVEDGRNEYEGVHDAPGRSSGAPLHDLANEEMGVFPDDIYGPDAGRFYQHMPEIDEESLSVIREARGKPDLPVKIYRAVPEEATSINPGDWVTPSRSYAEEHAAGEDGWKILELTVPARELFTDANSIHEFGWDPDKPVTAAALNYSGPGGMVALYPLENEARAIARKNGEPAEDLHVTLFFFEDATDLPEELTVDGFGQLSGQISGIARFQEGEDGVPIVALPSVVGLDMLRAYLTGQLSGYSEKYGFIPHMTLGYDQAEDPEGAVGLPVTFTHVCVSTKDGKREFPLGPVTASGRFDRPAGRPAV